MVLNYVTKSKQVQELAILRRRGLLPQNYEFDEAFEDDALLSDYYGRLRNNVLYEPVSPKVAKYLKPGINVIPDEIDDSEAWVLENKMFGRPTFRPRRDPVVEIRRYNTIAHVPERRRRQSWPAGSAQEHRFRSRPATPLPIIIAPFILRESNV